MNFIKTEIPDVIIIEPNVYIDPRGYFMESFRKDKFVAAEINAEFFTGQPELFQVWCSSRSALPKGSLRSG